MSPVRSSRSVAPRRPVVLLNLNDARSGARATESATPALALCELIKLQSIRSNTLDVGRGVVLFLSLNAPYIVAVHHRRVPRARAHGSVWNPRTESTFRSRLFAILDGRRTWLLRRSSLEHDLPKPSPPPPLFLFPDKRQRVLRNMSHVLSGVSPLSIRLIVALHFFSFFLFRERLLTRKSGTRRNRLRRRHERTIYCA